MNSHSLLHLLHLVSPNLPTGAFSYSQGLEWAVEAGWVHDKSSLEQWLSDLISNSMVHIDVPIFRRMFEVIECGEISDLEQWSDLLFACRESSEMQAEEQTRGRALYSLLESLNLLDSNFPAHILKKSQLAGYVYMAIKWHISMREAALGYVWSWLDNQLLTGVKIIPLGQSQGQQLLLQLSSSVARNVDKGLACSDAEIGAASPAFTLACCLHETQYTRLYRS